MIDILVFGIAQVADGLFIFFNIFFLLAYSYHKKLVNNFFFVSTYFTKNIMYMFIYLLLKVILLINYFHIPQFWGTDLFSSIGGKGISLLSYYYTSNIFITYFSGVHCTSLYSLKFQILLIILGIISLCYFYLFFYYNKKSKIQVIHVFFFSSVIYLLSWVIPFQNLFYIFFTFETLTYLLIGLIALLPNRYSSEALSKFFIISSISGVLTLFGILQFYVLTGSLNLMSLYQFIAIFGANESNFIGFFVFLILFSAISKLGVLPISWYVFDLYQASILPVTFLLAVTLKVGIFFFINLFFLFLNFYTSQFLYTIFLFLSVFSAFAGCILTLKEYNLNRFFSTNSIMSSGFLLSTFYFGVNPYSMNIAGLQYLLAYVLNMIAIFYVFINLLKLEKVCNSDSTIVSLNDLKGFAKTSIFFSCILTVILFSFIGIPPLIGFVGKFAILWTLFIYHKFFLLFFLILISVISSFFYLRVIQFIWFFNFDSSNIFYMYVTVNKFYKAFTTAPYNIFLVNFLTYYNFKLFLVSIFSYLVFWVSIITNFYYIVYYLEHFYAIHKYIPFFFRNIWSGEWYSSLFSNKDSI